MMSRVVVVGMLAGVILEVGSGCATIVSGSRQKIKIDSEPTGAEVRIWEQTEVTPCVVTLKRNRACTVVFSKEGYEQKKIYLNCEMNPWVWGNIGFGGLIGVVIDYSTGAANKLSPDVINVTLNKIPQEVTAPLPAASGSDASKPVEPAQPQATPAAEVKPNP